MKIIRIILTAIIMYCVLVTVTYCAAKYDSQQREQEIQHYVLSHLPTPVEI